jgi:hypothetical protein
MARTVAASILFAGGLAARGKRAHIGLIVNVFERR